MSSFVGADAQVSTVGAPAVPWANLGSFASGDVAVAFVIHSNASTVTTPSGWTKIGNTTANAAFTDVYTKTLTGSETGSQTFTVSSSSKAVAMIEVWRGKVQPTSAELSSPTVDTATVSTTTAVPALAHSGNIHWITATAVANSTPPTGFTQPALCTLGSAGFTTGGGAKCGGIAHSASPESDGNVGSGSWTRNNAASCDWLTYTVAMVDATVRITKTQATTWDTRARVPKSTATTWNTLARVTKSTSTTWQTRQRVAKSTATTWNVAGTLTRIFKSTSTTWQTRARVVKTQATTWDVANVVTRIFKTTATTWNTRARVTKSSAASWDTEKRITKSTATTWNVTSMISEANWPAYIGHRGSDPGPEETLFAYDTLYGRSPNYWHEGDCQTLNDGTTQVGSHDDTIDRMYSSGPVSTGNISSMTPAQWDATFLRVNTGFTGAAQQAMRLSAWIAKYGKNTNTPAIGIWENKPGTTIATTLATFAGCKGTVIVNCDTLTDAQAAVAAGFTTCYQTDTPNFATDFTPNGIKYLSINYTAMTGTIATNAIAAGVKVLMYTVNSTTTRDSMLALFSDTSYAGFFSNKPQTIAGTSRITKSTSTTWVARARVAKSTATTWNTLARITKATATTWDVAGVLARIVKTQATTWNTRARIIKSTATTWVTRQRVPKSTATTYKTLARLSKNQTTTWATRKRVAKTQATTWNVAASASPAATWWCSDGTTWKQADVYESDGTTWTLQATKVSNGAAWT